MKISSFFKACYREILFLSLIIMLVGICKAITLFNIQAVEPALIFSPDSSGYVDTARAFLETGHFAIHPDRPDVLQVVRTPGYPFFIASIFSFFGENYSILMLVQIFISLGTIMMTYLIARIRWNATIAGISAILLTFDLSSFVNSQKVLTDTLFAFILTLTVAVGISALKTPKYLVSLGVLHSILLSVAALIRPVIYYAIIPVIVIFVITTKMYVGWQARKIVSTIAVIIIPWVILIGGWQFRNYLTTGRPEFSYIMGWNLLFCRGARIVAQHGGITFDEARQRLGYNRYGISYITTSGPLAAQLDRQWTREGLRLIFQHPRLFVESQVRGALRMMLGTRWRMFLSLITGKHPGQTELGGPAGDLFKLSLSEYIRKWVFGKTSAFTLFILAESHLILLYGGFVFSIWRLVRKRETLFSVDMLMWSLIVYLFVVSISAGPEATVRFRIPLMPMLALYAGYGISKKDPC